MLSGLEFVCDDIGKFVKIIQEYRDGARFYPDGKWLIHVVLICV